MSNRNLMGARVTVGFSTHPNLTGTVVWTPSDTGDAWHIVDDEGVMFLVQQYDWMRVDKEQNDE